MNIKAQNQAHSALPEGFQLHWYVLKSVLGRGGFGITYLAQDTNLGQPVAIKEYLPTEFAAREHDSTVQPKTGEQGEIYRWGLQRFLKEAQTLAQFRHPNIVRVLSVFEYNNTAYMVMEYEEGEDLAKIFNRGEMTSERELLNILLPVMDGLALVHEAGFIHRDIKPSNIYLRNADHSPVLLDFGSARQAVGEHTRTLTSLVSYGYAPYEQYQNASERQGPWTDIYALGATLYFAITGKLPVEALARGSALLNDDVDPYIPVGDVTKGTYSATFLTAIDQALQFRVDARPQTIKAWASMLQGAADLGDDDAGEDRTVLQPRRRARARSEAPDETTGRATTIPTVKQQAKRPWSLIGVSSIVLVAVIGLVVYLMREPPEPEPRLPTPEELAQQQRQREIERLIAAADQAFQDGNLIPPAPDSALEAYQRVLELDEANSAARGGMQRIVNHYLALAEQSLVSDDFDSVEKYMDVLEIIRAPGGTLVELQRRVDQRRQALIQAERDAEEKSARDLAAQRTQQIDRLIAAAEQSFEAGRLAPPAADNALEAYRQVLRIDPRNTQARAGVERIAAIYRSRAESSLTSDDFVAMRGHLGVLDTIEGQQVFVGRLRQRATQRQRELSRANAERQQAQEIDGLVAVARQAFRSGRLVPPEPDNALAAYRKILSLDRDNTTARDGIERIADVYKQRTERALADGDFDSVDRNLAVLASIGGQAAFIQQISDQVDDAREPAVIDGATALLRRFKRAIETRDMKELERVSVLSSERRQLFTALFANYASIRFQIRDFSYVAVRKAAFATLDIEQVITHAGDIATPGPSWQQFGLEIRSRGGTRWEKIRW